MRQARPDERSFLLSRRTSQLMLTTVLVYGWVLAISLFLYWRTRPGLFSDLTGFIAPLTAGLVSILGAFTVLVMRRRNQSIGIRISLAGHPGAGKTFFVNTLYSLLQQEHARELSFVPDTSTARALAVSRRRANQGEWPSSTSVGSVIPYKVTIQRRRVSVLSLALLGHSMTELEIGDSAGERWEGDSQAETRTEFPLLMETDFFEYVATSRAIFWLIDASDIEDRPNLVRNSVDDLISTIEVLRTTVRDPGSFDLPIAVVLTKTDLLSPNASDALTEWLRHPQDERFTFRGDEPLENSLFHLARLGRVLANLTRNWQLFPVCALRAAARSGIIDGYSVLFLKSVESTAYISWQRTQAPGKTSRPSKISRHGIPFIDIDPSFHRAIGFDPSIEPMGGHQEEAIDPLLWCLSRLDRMGLVRL